VLCLQLFFGILALVLMGVKRKADPRAKFLMSGSPAIKLGLWLTANALPFLLPNNVVLAYGYIARLGSALFLIIQLFLLLDFVLSLNERWVAAGEEDERYYHWMAGISAACYIGCFVLIGVDSFLSLFCCALSCKLVQ
jgi:serine incorporator 1/3